MNERIKELIVQASYNIIETDGAPIISSEFNKEKFAELIVRECVDTLYQHGWTDAADGMKQHFGVE